MIDYWISPAAVKREFEATKSKCLNLAPLKTQSTGQWSSLDKLHKK